MPVVFNVRSLRLQTRIAETPITDLTFAGLDPLALLF